MPARRFVSVRRPGAARTVARRPVPALPAPPPRLLPRPVADAPLRHYEAALLRAGFAPVAGADEAGRGACAGPLVVAACILPPGRRGCIDGLNDSKLIPPPVRERLYTEVVRRAVAWSVVIIPAREIDAFGLHVANLAGMRRAVARLGARPAYTLTDGFPVPGLGMPNTAIWKGDASAACVAAASILAKVTRDRIMVELADRFPEYEFARHKGYVTPEHSAALRRFGPCDEHRRRYINVRRATAMLDNVDVVTDVDEAADWEIA